MQPTVIFETSASVPGRNSLDVSRAHVGFVAGDRPLYSDETSKLIRSRLSAASLAIAVVLGAAFIGNLVTGVTSLWWFRGLILLIAVGSAVILHYYSALTLSQLRILELVVFGAVVIQLSLMLVTRLAEFAVKNDAVSVVSVRYQFLLAWCVLIFIYGALMPNTWKRGAGIMTPAAILPYLLIAFQRWLSPEIASLLDSDRANSPLPFPLVAAMVATFTTHVINSARREAFKARQFGQYRLMERLGAGGMGEVYTVYDLEESELCYAPPFGSAKDPVNFAGMVAADILRGDMPQCHWNAVGNDFLLDVRNPAELAVETIPGAVNIPLPELRARLGELPRNRGILVICRSGQRAYYATRILLQHGFKVRNLAGGMLSRSHAASS